MLYDLYLETHKIVILKCYYRHGLGVIDSPMTLKPDFYLSRGGQAGVCIGALIPDYLANHHHLPRCL